MRYAPINRAGGLGLFLAAVLLLVGCSTIQTIPTAIVYDRDLDEFHVEVRHVKGIESPIYPGSLDVFTECDGERHAGLIPKSEFRVPRKQGSPVKFWMGPMTLTHHGSGWRIHRSRAVLESVEGDHVDGPIWIMIQKRYAEPKPKYFIQIRGTVYTL